MFKFLLYRQGEGGGDLRAVNERWANGRERASGGGLVVAPTARAFSFHWLQPAMVLSSKRRRWSSPASGILLQPNSGASPLLQAATAAHEWRWATVAANSSGGLARDGS
jgi:hypothetical protein